VTPSEPPFIKLENEQAAAVVIGQADFGGGAENRGGALDAHTIASPYGNAAFYGGVLYLADYVNERVLGYHGIPEVSGVPADFVLGQPDFTSDGYGPGREELSGPQNPHLANGKLVVADYGNNRVLIWNTPPKGGGLLPDVVVGQLAWGDDAAQCTRIGLSYPEAAFLQGGRLLVADSDNHRVLIWNRVPAAHGEPADLVLGQVDFASCSPNRGGVASADSFFYPSSIWTNGQRLFVADSKNNRVLVWNSFPTANGQAADLVLGQADLGSADEGVSASALTFPYFLHSNGVQLFVADSGNHRVLVWNAFPTANAAPADVVLGQPDLDSATQGTSATTMSFPAGVFAEGPKLIVTDNGNSRYLVYDSLP
jgi:hypothetical protein